MITIYILILIAIQSSRVDRAGWLGAKEEGGAEAEGETEEED